MSSSSMKILMKALGLIIVLVLVLGAALLLLLHMKSNVDPAIAGVLFDLFLIPFAAMMIGGLFFWSFVTMFLKEWKRSQELPDRRDE